MRLLPSIWAAYQALLAMANPKTSWATLLTKCVLMSQKACNLCVGGGLVALHAEPLDEHVAKVQQGVREVMRRAFVV